MNNQDFVKINGEYCVRLKNYPHYVVSRSGRFYRTEPYCRSERLIQKQNPNAYFNEVSHSVCKNKSNSFILVALVDKNDKRTTARAARLVAEAFGKKIKSKKPIFNYIDGDFRNVSFDNLMIGKRKMVHKFYKIKESDVPIIRELLEKNVSLKTIAKIYNCSDMSIHRIKTGECWNEGIIIIEKPQAPFYIEDGKIRKYIAIFDHKKVQDNIKKKFTIKRNYENPTDNLIWGIVNGYKLSLKHQNITRARELVKKLNNYFFIKI